MKLIVKRYVLVIFAILLVSAALAEEDIKPAQGQEVSAKAVTIKSDSFLKTPAGLD